MNSEPAFPTESAHQSGNTTWHFEGMTLRDWFAGQVLIGIASRNDYDDWEQFENRARRAYQMAEAMLKQREGNA